jgi:pimeloyl-ACP methyl ester carboxylesterase
MIYFISGLGADERVFQFLKLNHVQRIHIKWLETSPTEDLQTYTSRLTVQIDTSQDVILIGVSFGGIIAQEIGKIISCKKIIIISSIKTSAELSWQMRLARTVKIYKVIPTSILIWANQQIADYYFGTGTKQESLLLKQIIADTDPAFLKWAINEIMEWKNDSYPKNLLHIHGNRDRIFPVRYINNVIEIPNGGHFMIVNKANEISAIILKALNEV